MQIILQGEHFNLQCAAEPQLNWLAYPYLAVGLLGGGGVGRTGNGSKHCGTAVLSRWSCW